MVRVNGHVEQRLPEGEGRSRILWTTDEYNRMAAVVADLVVRQPEKSLLQHAQQAQLQVIIAERRRKLEGLNAIEPLVRRVRIRLEEMRRRAEEISKPIPAPPEPPSPEEVLAQLDTGQLFAEAISRFMGTLETIAERQSSLEDLVRRLAIRPAENGKPAPVLAQIAAPAKLTRITIVGLMPAQANRVKEACGHGRAVEITCPSRELQCPQFGKNPDHVILMCKFIRHSWQNAAFKVFAGQRDKVHLHHGGIEKVIELVGHILAGTTSTIPLNNGRPVATLD
jgi:hypothetical protein